MKRRDRKEQKDQTEAEEERGTKARDEIEEGDKKREQRQRGYKRKKFHVKERENVIPPRQALCLLMVCKISYPNKILILVSFFISL